MSKDIHVAYPCTSATGRPEPEETDTTARPEDSGSDAAGGVTPYELAAASGFNVTTSRQDTSTEGTVSGTVASGSSDEALAMRESIRSTPGAFHVERVRRVPAAEVEEEANRSSEDGEGSTAPSLGTSEAAVAGGGAVIDAQVEVVAVQVDEAVATYQAVPVVDALAAAPIPEDGDGWSYQLQSENSQSLRSLEDGSRSHAAGVSSLPSSRPDAPSDAPGSPSTTGKEEKSDNKVSPKRHAIGGLAIILIVAVAIGLGLGLEVPRNQDAGTDSSLSPAPQADAGDGLQGENTVLVPSGGAAENGHRLVEMEISPKIETSLQYVSSSLILALMLPTTEQGTMSRSLIVGWDRDGGVVNIYRSKMVRGNESTSFGPFIESASISLDKDNVGELDGGGGQESNESYSSGSSPIILDGGVEGESFVVSYRNCIRFFTSQFHETMRKVVIENYESPSGDKGTSVLSSPSESESQKWYQRGQTLVSNDTAIQGFGSSIAFSSTGAHSFRRLVVGSDSGHVRAYRYRLTNDTVPGWQRIDGGLLDPPNNNTGRAVVAMSGSGTRFVVGYPTLGKVCSYRFTDHLTINEDAGVSYLELSDELYSESGNDSDMFGQSLSLDAFGNFLVVGAKGYARAYWLKVTPQSVSGVHYVSAGGRIVGEESDGKAFGAIVASGRVPLHAGGCIGCPFILDKQRIAVSSPGFNNGRGRVIIYQYNEDDASWEKIASSINGASGDEVAQSVRLSPDMGAVATTSAFGEARIFRLQSSF